MVRASTATRWKWRSPDGEREDVRLIGVDTPETVKPDTPVQCFGPRASRFTHTSSKAAACGCASGASAATVYGRCSPTSGCPTAAWSTPSWSAAD